LYVHVLFWLQLEALDRLVRIQEAYIADLENQAQAASIRRLGLEAKAMKYDELVGKLVPTGVSVSTLQVGLCRLGWDSPVGVRAVGEYEVKMDGERYAFTNDLFKSIDGLPSGSSHKIQVRAKYNIG
jgi:hypothetical protein